MGDQMKKRTQILFSCISISVLLILILDTKTAISGTLAGIDLCLKTLIPALFPFLLISSLCCKSLLSLNSNIISTLLRPCKIPKGAEMIFVVGALGGYPLGASLIGEAYTHSNLSKTDANRMLMFCSNAGPAFIFGVVGQLFTERWMPWLLWSTHLLSAYFVGIITARKRRNLIGDMQTKKFNFSEAIISSVKTMGSICASVLLFRMIIAFFEKWFFIFFPYEYRVLLTGLIELSNGCMLAGGIENPSVRFLISVLLINLGGACVTIQTASVASKLSIYQYVSGKIYQCILSLLLALPIQAVLFSWSIQKWIPSFIILLFFAIILIAKHFSKNSSILLRNNI